MAEAASKQSESMEDILQSIKRIIEDDGDAEIKPAAAVPVEASADVLELTEVIGEDGSVSSLPPLPTLTPAPAKQPPAAAAKPEPVKEPPTPEPAPAPAPPKAPVTEPARTEPPAPTQKPVPKISQTEDALVSEQAAQAAMAALKPIVDNSQKDYSIPHIPSSTLRNGNTVEDLVLESLKPMLKAWLDEHLPLIVQKIVEKEVKRIVKFHQD